MKVVFSDTIPHGQNFSSYEHDEKLLYNENYVDIKNIVNINTATWLDELAKSHSIISEYLAHKSRWWWVSPASRLDARPWGQEKLIKPLFFSIAILEWFSNKSDRTSLILINCPIEVSEYLSELEPKLILAYSCVPKKERVAKMFVKSFFIMLKNIVNIMRFHVLNKSREFKDVRKNVVIYELIHGVSIENSCRYYFTSTLDQVDRKKLTYLAVGIVKNYDRLPLEETDAEQLVMYDLCSTIDLIKSVIKQIYLQYCTIVLIANKPPCIINNKETARFWNRYLSSILDRSILEPILLYSVLSKLLPNAPVERLIFPYEEKGSERAILFAASENNIKTIGFTPHPQHSLAVSMRDIKGSSCPKPNAYAFCGTAYISFFTEWAAKEGCQMTVWGSEKGKLLDLEFQHNSRQRKIKVLLVLSHPNELKVFYNWLQSKPELCNIAKFSLRSYKAVGSEHFNKSLSVMKKEFPNVSEVSGNLFSNLKKCDVVAFCATSAGIEAINMGRPGFYLDLNDFFEINPCFDDLSKMQPSYSACEFLLRLKEWSSKNEIEKKNVLIEQRNVTTKILTKINPEEIHNTLS